MLLIILNKSQQGLIYLSKLSFIKVFLVKLLAILEHSVYIHKFGKDQKQILKKSRDNFVKE